MLVFSAIITLCCLIYLFKNIGSKQKKENSVVFLCSVSGFVCTFFYCYYEVYYFENQDLQADGAICIIMPIVYKITLAINRCSCNLIFAYRYKTINKLSSIFAARKAYWFSIIIIVVFILQTIFDCIYFSAPYFKPKLTDCLSFNLEVEVHVATYIYATNGCFLITLISQTVILVEIIRPIFNHFTRLNKSTISNNSIRSSLYRIVLSTLVFCLSDFCIIIAHVIRAMVFQTRSPIIFVLNLSINTVSLMCSYEDYNERFLPFLCCSTTEQNSKSKRTSVTQSAKKNFRETRNRQKIDEREMRVIEVKVDQNTSQPQKVITTIPCSHGKVNEASSV